MSEAKTVQITPQTTYQTLLQIFSNEWKVFTPSNEQVIQAWKETIQQKQHGISPVGKMYCKGVMRTPTAHISVTLIECTKPGSFTTTSYNFFPSHTLLDIADRMKEQVTILNQLNNSLS